MSVLAGVWVESGAPAERAVPPHLREALRRACGPGLMEIQEGPLWLLAAPGSLARDRSRVLALMGLLAGPAERCSPESLLARWKDEPPDPFPPGHYAAACADLEAKVLTLYRDPFGMARLYHASDGGLFLFSTHAKALLAGGIRGGLDREAALEAVLSSDLGVIFGSRTLLSGIREMPPGEVLVLSPGRTRTRAVDNPFIETWRPEPPPSPPQLRRDLVDAVGAAVGPEKRVAVALSGGIDSSTIAAMAVELLGAKQVEAYTYEFDEPSHPSETAYAALVCRHLGIAHHVVRMGLRQYVESLPELFWRLEAPRMAPGAWIPFSRALAAGGFRRVLTGDGMELSLGLGEEFEVPSAIARAIDWMPNPGLLLRHWRPTRFSGWPPRSWARRVHPGLEAPADTAYHMILCVLRHNGLIPDVGPFYPVALRDLARGAAESERVREAVERRRNLPLAEQFRFHRINSYYLHRLMRGKPTAWRELGGPWHSCPALILSGAPLPRKEHWVNNRSLLQAAVGGDVPDEIWARPKITNQSILPRAWSAKIAESLAPLSADAADRLAVSGAARPELLLHYGRSLALLELWARIFDAGPVPTEAPTLESLDLAHLFAPV